MAKISGAWRPTLIAFGAIMMATAPALTQGPRGLGALNHLEHGLWQFRDLDAGGAALPPLCVVDPGVLMQLQHRGAPCSRLVIASDAKGATVHYTCPAGGFGRTSLRVETPRLAKIDTQGISGNAPFAYRIEARRTGPCAGNHISGRR